MRQIQSNCHSREGGNPVTSTLEPFHEYHALCTKRVENFLSYFLGKISSNHDDIINETKDSPTPLFEALKYSILNGGKRIRPLLVYLTGEAFQTPLENLNAPAAAVELIHCFSLVHDDLPAMDNDDFRRGKPTCHKVFGEANAILVGDALQSLSFELLSDPLFNPNPVSLQVQMIHTLSKATGVHGMVGGQALDIAEEHKNNLKDNLNNLENTLINTRCLEPETSRSSTSTNTKAPDSLPKLIALHRKKTGVLITASVLLGLQASQITDRNIIDPLTLYAERLGLAFQVQDDILDIEGSLESLGKTPGKDTKASKLTFPKILGLEGAKAYKQELHMQMLSLLKKVPMERKMLLRFEQVTEFFLERKA